jgi:hypothetical protein
MRTQLLMTMTGIIAFSAPAYAGTLTYTDGHAVWQSTQCTQPTEPSSIAHAHHEMPADKMNVLMTQYNQYVAAMQSYLDCVSNEAQTDSTTANQAISTGAQSAIDAAQKKITEVGQDLKAKK